MREKSTDEEFKTIVESCFSIRECLTRLSLSPTGGNYSTFHRRIKRLGLKIDHFKGQAANKGKKFGPKRPIADYLSNKVLISSHNLKKRLLAEGIFKHQCSGCKLTHWQGEKISIELDHINGNPEDNSLENLRLLCPNCHAQTDNYRGKNQKRRKNKDKQGVRSPKKSFIQNKCTDCNKDIDRKASRCKSCAAKKHNKTKIEWPPRDELLQMVNETNYSATARKLGVSDNAVRKRLK